MTNKTTNEWVAQVTEFQNKFELPRITAKDTIMHRSILLHEEFKEFMNASKAAVDSENDEEFDKNMVEMLDALGDMIVVIIGTANLLGMDIDEAMRRIHASNMSKLGKDGTPIYDSTGKVKKGPDFFKPKLDDLISTEKAVNYVGDIILKRLTDGSLENFLETEEVTDDSKEKTDEDKLVDDLTDSLKTSLKKIMDVVDDDEKESVIEKRHIKFEEEDKVEDEESITRTYKITGLHEKCPFCGGEAMGISLTEKKDNKTVFTVACKKCGAKVKFSKCFFDAVSSWVDRGGAYDDEHEGDPDDEC